MTLLEFDALDMNGRAEWLWQHEMLEERFEFDRVIRLYSLPDFYAELVYDVIANQIVEIRGFDSLHLLAPYLKISS